MEILIKGCGGSLQTNHISIYVAATSATRTSHFWKALVRGKDG
ncbi:unnamed protein product [Brassica oleracea var. botrytis]